MSEGKKIGRPAKRPEERAGAQIQFRVRGDLQPKLADAAAKSRRSISEECEYRLNRSFEREAALMEVFGHGEHRSLIMALCNAIRLLEQHPADGPGDKLQAYATVIEVVEALAEKSASQIKNEAGEAGNEAYNAAVAVLAADAGMPLLRRATLSGIMRR